MQNSTIAAERTSRARSGQGMRSTTAKCLVTAIRCFSFSFSQLLLGRMRPWKGRWRMIPETSYLTYTTRCWNERRGKELTMLLSRPCPAKSPRLRMQDINVSSYNHTATSHPQQCQILLKISRDISIKATSRGKKRYCPQKEIIWKIWVEKNRGLRERVVRRIWPISSVRFKNGNSEITRPSFESSSINCLTSGMLCDPLFLKLSHVIKWG